MVLGDGANAIAGGVARLMVLGDGVSASPTKDNQIQEGVSSQPVGTVDRGAGSFACSPQTIHHLVLATLVGDDLSSPVGGDSAHVVVDGGDDGDGFAGDVDAGEDHGRLGDSGQTLGQLLWGQVVQLEVAVVLFRPAAASLPDLDGLGAGDDVPGGQVLCHRSVPLHETLALGVDQETALTSAALCHQAAGSVDSCGVELDELHVLVGEAGAGDHGGGVAGASVRRGSREVGLSVASSGQDCVL